VDRQTYHFKMSWFSGGQWRFCVGAGGAIIIHNFIHHKVANNSKNIQQWKLGTEKQTKY